ncbi:MAG: branched chain amino acid aminotransferase [candidate division Zixibacteria bacterium CG_4_9_14_3_um_filter_46_8]|nr:MAG: branched chain amino acid aminotransferase [candidate division Zixibacteria bacterium CG_4_9_14_3_um_filter_46_8]
MGFADQQGKIWMNGKLVDWKDAQIHILSHVIHYGSAVFEGLRCYHTKKGPAIFRLQDHTRRLFNSAKIYRMEIPYSEDDINHASIDLIKVNNLESCYIRPLVYRGYKQLGVDPSGCPIDVAIAVWPWGAYLGPQALENGVPVCVSSWNRFAPNTAPSMAKAASNYMSGQLIKLEAISHGYVEGIALDVYGHVSEGSGENIFIVRDGVLITPPFGASILAGITRNTVKKIAEEMGYEVREQMIPREALYISDEAFFTGSAAEITPINSIDRIQIGGGKRGPITKKLQDRFFAILEGDDEDKYGWLTYI